MPTVRINVKVAGLRLVYVAALAVMLGAWAPSPQPLAAVLPPPPATTAPLAGAGLSLENPTITGVVQSVDGDQVTLADGRSFLIGERSVRRAQWSDASALQPGQDAGILTELQSNGTLTVVSV